MPARDPCHAAILVAGMMSSMVLLSASSLPLSLTVSELQGLGEDSAVTVSGLLVSLRTYDTGTEAMMLSDEAVSAIAKVVCSPGPGNPPSQLLSIGDLLSVSGDCTFEDGTPVVFCHYDDVRLLRGSEEELTVRALCGSWWLYEGDEISIVGDSVRDESGGLRLFDEDGVHSIAMELDTGVSPMEGKTMVCGRLSLDTSTMTIALRASSLTSVA